MTDYNSRMKIIDASSPGGPDRLEVAERPIPEPLDAEVLIRVAAAGVNRADVLQRRGSYPAPPGAPTWPGLEVSGTIVRLGPSVRELAVGDEVCALLQGGGYAQYAAAAEGATLKLPRGMDLLHGAAIAESYFTVYSNVFMFGRLMPGESFLVHGGSSGIGVAAIQLARALGSTVFATAGSDEKCRACESLGAQAAFNYRGEDFVARVRETTNGRGVDVILDMVAGDYTARNIEALAPEGRLVIIATQGGADSTVNIGKIMAKRITLTGSTLRSRDVAFKRLVKEKLLRIVWPLFESGELRVLIDRVFPLEQAAEAQRRMESSEHIGKIVLRVPQADT